MGFFDAIKNSMGVEEQAKEAKQIHVTMQEDTKASNAKKKQLEKKEWFEPEGELAVDVYHTKQDIVIQATVAGVNPNDLDISIENDVVTISGVRNNPSQDQDKTYILQECYWGPFSKQVILSEPVDTNNVEARLQDNVFTLRLPKIERQTIKKIKVRM